jgi:hypothetical protein
MTLTSITTNGLIIGNIYHISGKLNTNINDEYKLITKNNDDYIFEPKNSTDNLTINSEEFTNGGDAYTIISINETPTHQSIGGRKKTQRKRNRKRKTNNKTKRRKTQKKKTKRRKRR